LVAGALALAGTACTADAEEVQPPPDQFYFPTGLALGADESRLFVANANSDLRYSSGSVLVVDLDEVDAIASAWIDDRQVPDGDDCSPDPDRREILVCDEAAVVLADSSVRVGNFIGELQAQPLDDGRLRLFAPVRGDPSVTWIDFDPSGDALDCGGSGSYPSCDEPHRLSQLRDDLELSTMDPEPFGLFVDAGGQFGVVTHLTTGEVTLFDAPVGGGAPILSDAKSGFFEPDRSTGVLVFGATGVAGRVATAADGPDASDTLIYVTSRTESRVQTLTVARPAGADGLPILVPSDYFFLNTVFPAQESRAIRFSDDGERAYVVNRRPPSIITVDASLDDTGRPRNEVMRATEICGQASTLAVADLGAGERVYVSCYRDGQVWAIDPIGQTIEAIIDVGRGPDAVLVAPDRRHLYVSNFLDDTVAVIDLTPSAATENRVVLRLGRRRVTGDQ
jgi:DNA-binding beta-propeller fold protein YncE